MPSPFPGMDPYLERPSLWPDVHHELISQIRAALNPRIRPRYVARVELRVYLADEYDLGRWHRIPDVRIDRGRRTKSAPRNPARNGTALQIAEPVIVAAPIDDTVEQAYLTIQEPGTGALVTVIELLSPSNKVPGSNGRASFLDKRREVLASDAHWVEIDLLRQGDRTTVDDDVFGSDYGVSVSRADDRGRVRYWPIVLRDRLPIVGIPLKDKDADAPLDLGAVLAKAYDVAEYDATVDYRRPPVPPLGAADARWANQLLRKKGLR